MVRATDTYILYMRHRRSLCLIVDVDNIAVPMYSGEGTSLLQPLAVINVSDYPGYAVVIAQCDMADTDKVVLVLDALPQQMTESGRPNYRQSCCDIIGRVLDAAIIGARLIL